MHSSFSRHAGSSQPAGACSTSGRQQPAPSVRVTRRCLVRASARAKKLAVGGKALLTGAPPPETFAVDISGQFGDAQFVDFIDVASSPLVSTEEPDLELLLPTSEGDDATITVDEDNPYTPADALSTAPPGLAGGEPALEALLAEGGADLSAQRICGIFPFPLDAFQRRSLELFLEGRSVVVCAPTGAGKTAIAEAAAAAVLARRQRVIYTTPLKALSNQKLFETRRRFGHARCGLQTGDASLNPDADIVVMTTEILRNIMYRTAELATENNTGAQSTREARLGDVGLIVLDEVHYLGDPHRGSVWEEVIINCPRHIQLLCMSATVQNPTDLGDWIAKEHMPCETIQTRFRPVPLHWQFAYFQPPKGVIMDDLLHTYDNGRQALNAALSTKKVLLEEARSILSRGPPPPTRGAGRRGNDYTAWSRAVPDAFDWEREMEALLEKDGPALQRRINARRVPDTSKTIKLLADKQMLPAIWFILSRKDCDVSAARAAGVPLTTAEQAAAITSEVAALRADQPEAVREELVPALVAGIASHHAGQLPGWKSLVERLFQRGMLRLVFATGTLAAGINMPARTTIISSLSKISADGPKLMPHNDLLQMAGRAGRRGFDTEGNCMVLQNRFEGAEEAWQIIKGGPEPIVSQFSVSYGLVLNLLSVSTLEQAHTFVSRSFGNYMATEGNARREREAVELEEEARALVESFKASATARAKELNARVKEAKDRLRALKGNVVAAQCASASAMLSAAPMPRFAVVNLAAGGGLERALLMPVLVIGEMPAPKEVLAAAEGPGGLLPGGKEPPPGPFFACLSADNRLMRASVVCVAGVLEGPAAGLGEEEAERVAAAVGAVRSNAWSSVEAGSLALQAALGTPSTSSVTRHLQARLPWRFVETDKGLAAQVAAQRLVVKAALRDLETQRRVAANSVSKDGSLEKMARAKNLLRRAEKLRTDSKAGGQLESTWKAFQATMEILICVDAMESGSLRIMPLGLLARNIQGGNELWLAMALAHPALNTLSGPALSALLAALLCPEVLSKPVTVWAAYPVSREVEEAVEALEPSRQLLQELQTDAGLTRWNDALLVDLRFAGLVEAWASGATWAQIMADSNLDDGDMARLLIRTIDLLKQLQHNAHLLPQLRDTAAEALRGMDRQPVTEQSF